MAAARACSMTLRTEESVSWAIASSSIGMASGSAVENISRAAASLAPGLSLISVRLPTAAAISRRRELLIRMTLISPVVSRSAASPVRASA